MREDNDLNVTRLSGLLLYYVFFSQSSVFNIDNFALNKLYKATDNSFNHVKFLIPVSLKVGHKRRKFDSINYKSHSKLIIPIFSRSSRGI